MDASSFVVRVAVRTVLPLSFLTVVAEVAACSGRVQPDAAAGNDASSGTDGGGAGGEGEPGVDVDGSAADFDAGPSDVDGTAAAGEDAGPPGVCTKPDKPAICTPPGGTISSSFDPVACGVASDPKACIELCAAWFTGGRTDGLFCMPAQSAYLDAGPPGSYVCGCNIP